MGVERPAGTGKGATRQIVSSVLALCLVFVLGLGIAACAGTGEAAPASTEASVSADSTSDRAPESDAAVQSDADTSTEPVGSAGAVDVEEYTATDTSYESATKSITISTVTTGSGSDTVTYYVADVQLDKGTDLLSAFSSGQYGGEAQDTSDIAEANNAIVAINGDYYGATGRRHHHPQRGHLPGRARADRPGHLQGRHHEDLRRDRRPRLRNCWRRGSGTRTPSARRCSKTDRS